MPLSGIILQLKHETMHDCINRRPVWLFVALCDSSSNLPELHTLWGNSKLECWNMALNLMEPLVKTAIGRQELPFPAFFEIPKPFRTRYALLHCQAIF